MLNSKNILIILTGSIACYKTCTVISRLKQSGHKIKTVMSPASLEFLGKSTVEGLTGEEPVTGLYTGGHAMDHINLVRWADLILVAPATANFINKIANGIGDDLLTTLFLAHDFQKPFLLAPAMNTKMYLHPVTQESIRRLKEMGVEILETASGVLACGEIGSGRLLEPDLLVSEVEQRLNLKNSATGPALLQKKEIRILITGGGTAEPIDDVRVITNKSTGRTAAFLADALTEAGMNVTYLHAASSILPKYVSLLQSFDTFKDLDSAIEKQLVENKFDFVIHAAAVSDYSVVGQPGKIESSNDEITLKLKRNPKLISRIKKISPQTKLVGFKLTSGSGEDVIASKVQRLFEESGCDYVVQNDWNNISTGQYSYRFYDKNGFTQPDSMQSLAASLFQAIVGRKENS